MIPNLVTRLLFVCGVATIALSVLLYFAAPLPKASQYEVVSTSKSLFHDEEVIRFADGTSHTIRAELVIRIEPPPKVKTGDAVVVVLTVTPRVSTVVDPPLPRKSDSLREFPLLSLIHQRMEQGEIAFSLFLAGAKVEPSGKNVVSSSGRAQWSVKPEGSGSLKGFVKPEFNKLSRDHAGKYRVEYSTAEYIPVNVISFEPVVTTKSVVSATGVFFGSLLTLPGILAFMKERREERKDRDADDRERGPKIIVPGDRNSNSRHKT
jgi:hypothetical protein